MTGMGKVLTMGIGIALLALALQAEAAEVRVKCEKRLNEDGSAERSKISVDAKDLAPGTYTAMVTSGDTPATSKLEATAGDEVEFDFDSNSNDVAAGANEIAPDFIQRWVNWTLLDASEDTVASDMAVLCTVKD